MNKIGNYFKLNEDLEDEKYFICYDIVMNFRELK